MGLNSSGWIVSGAAGTARSRIPVCSNNARKIRNCLFVDGRRLSLAGLLNLREVLTGQDCHETGCHTPIKAHPAPVGKSAHKVGLGT
jgi:hypothetical protein